MYEHNEIIIFTSFLKNGYQLYDRANKNKKNLIVMRSQCEIADEIESESIEYFCPSISRISYYIAVIMKENIYDSCDII
jgi:hypothetical protein